MALQASHLGSMQATSAYCRSLLHSWLQRQSKRTYSSDVVFSNYLECWVPAECEAWDLDQLVKSYRSRVPEEQAQAKQLADYMRAQAFEPIYLDELLVSTHAS